MSYLLHAPPERRAKTHVQRARMFGERGERRVRDDHSRTARSLAQDRAAEGRQRLSQLQLLKRLGRSRHHRRAQSERVESAANAFLEVVEIAAGQARFKSRRERRQHLTVEQRHAGPDGKLGGDRRAAGAGLR